MLVFAAIAPHGGDIVPQLAEDLTTMAQTRAAMEELTRRCQAARPDTVVIADPHGLLAQGVITVGATRYAAGIVGEPRGRHIKVVFENDLEFLAALEPEFEKQDIPYFRLVGEKRKKDAVLPMQWGAVIPLWYTAHPLTPRPRILVLGPDRQLPREVLVRTGVAVARAAAHSEKRVAFIASADLGHAHTLSGPYGYSAASMEHDVEFCAAVAEEDLPRLLEWNNDFLEEAKVDAYWQVLMLMGALGHTPLRGELLSYEAPTYFGMAVAAYEPATETEQQ